MAKCKSLILKITKGQGRAVGATRNLGYPRINSI